MANKQKRHLSTPIVPSKNVRLRAIEPELGAHAYSFRYIDHGGPFCFALNSSEVLRDMMEKLGHLEQLNDAELGKQGSHLVETNQFSTKAIERLRYIGYDQMEALFSLRIQGKQRVWAHRKVSNGISTFYLVWCDPEHEVCPSQLKNT